MKHFFIFHSLALHYSWRISKGNPAVDATSAFVFSFIGSTAMFWPLDSRL